MSRIRQDATTTNIQFADDGTILTISAVRNNIKGQKQQFEIPAPSRRLKLIAEAHMNTGHLGTWKTRSWIESFGFSWVGIDEDIARIIQTCLICQRDNAHAVIHHPARAIPIPNGVFDRIHMDLLELPASPTTEIHLTLCRRISEHCTHMRVLACISMQCLRALHAYAGALMHTYAVRPP